MHTFGVTLQYVPPSSYSSGHCYKLCGAVQAKQGQAEVFGTELSLGERLALRGQKLAVRAYSRPYLELCWMATYKWSRANSGQHLVWAQVFTWHGAVLELTADAEGLEEVTDVVYAHAMLVSCL